MLPAPDGPAVLAALSSCQTVLITAREGSVDDVIVQTKTGAVRGRRVNGVCRFRGIPYATPPVGGRRFLPPEPAARWDGVRDASDFGPAAMQIPSVLETERGLPDEMSEDCLTLNIWAPDDARSTGNPLPVLMWIHGGSFINGSGSMPWYDGTVLAARGDVVVVAVNYRLGVFGYLDLSAIAGPGYAGGGNAGLLDQVACLIWIRDNIASFGGDPNRVCVVGESAGAMSVGTLLATPAAQGLLHRAILQSGTPVGQPRPHAEANAADLFDELHLPATQAGLSDLLEIDAAELLDAAAQITSRAMLAAQTGARSSFPWSPVVDGIAVPEDPKTAIRSGASASVPVLIGTTQDEMRITRRIFPDRPPMSEDLLHEHLRDTFGPRAGEARAAYGQWDPKASPDDLWDTIMSDRIFAVPTADFIESRTACRAPTWTYLFDWRSSAEGGRYGAAHTLEIPFVFGTFDAPGVAEFMGRPPAEAERLAGAMQDAWVSFARDGVPAADGLPEWPACDDGRQPTMMLGDDVRVLDDPLALRLSIWRGA